MLTGRSSLTNEKDHRYFLNRFVCVGEFFDGGGPPRTLPSPCLVSHEALPGGGGVFAPCSLKEKRPFSPAP